MIHRNKRKGTKNPGELLKKKQIFFHISCLFSSHTENKLANASSGKVSRITSPLTWGGGGNKNKRNLNIKSGS